MMKPPRLIKHKFLIHLCLTYYHFYYKGNSYLSQERVQLYVIYDEKTYQSFIKLMNML
jgi:hypothetical protein